MTALRHTVRKAILFRSTSYHALVFSLSSVVNAHCSIDKLRAAARHSAWCRQEGEAPNYNPFMKVSSREKQRNRLYDDVERGGFVRPTNTGDFHTSESSEQISGLPQHRHLSPSEEISPLPSSPSDVTTTQNRERSLSADVWQRPAVQTLSASSSLEDSGESALGTRPTFLGEIQEEQGLRERLREIWEKFRGIPPNVWICALLAFVPGENESHFWK